MITGRKGGGTLVLQDSFVNALGQAEDEYEVMALCYCELLTYTSDTDILFITRVGHLAEDREYGPCAQVFEELRQTIICYAQEINMSPDCDGKGFDEFRTNLIEALKCFQCPEQLAISVCIPICMFYILEALDSYVEKNLELVLDDYRSYGPLNKGDSQTKCLVYLQERESFLSEAYADGGTTGFRKPLRETRIGAIFHTVLLIVRKRPLPIPKIIPILLNRDCKQTIKQQKMIRIATIPYIGFDTFLFHEANAQEPCIPSKIPEGPFYVDYIEDLENDNVQRITTLLKLAVQGGANIIVFPEFIMSENMMDSIRGYLRKLEFSYKKQLLLVFAGTCYHWDGKNKGNNVLHMFNANGTEIGRYYKYSPFLIQSEEKVHGTPLMPKQQEDCLPKRRYIKTCEILSDPGKECTLLDIEIIGRILPAICRDVIDDEFTTSLAKLFMPSILMVPAWSRSVASFDARLSLLADTIHTASLLCNCCNAVEGTEKKAIGRLFIPQKQSTNMNSRPPLDVSRDQGCAASCKERGGCVVQIDINFSQGKPEAKLNTFFSTNDK